MIYLKRLKEIYLIVKINKILKYIILFEKIILKVVAKNGTFAQLFKYYKYIQNIE